MEKDQERHKLWSSSLDDDTDPDNIARPYNCTFCKRGFTNAQALGGHMNIHRRDKGDQKRASTAARSSTLPRPSTISILNVTSPSKNNFFSTDQNFPANGLSSSTTTLSSPMPFSHFIDSNAAAKIWPCGSHDLNVEPKQLLLFVDRSPVDHQREEVRYDEDDHEDYAQYCELKLAQSDHPVAIAADDEKELDLELRLGPVGGTRE